MITIHLASAWSWDSPEDVELQPNFDTEGADGSGADGGMSPEGADGGMSPEGAAGGMSPEGAAGGMSPEGAVGGMPPEGAVGSRSPEGAVGMSPSNSAVSSQVNEWMSGACLVTGHYRLQNREGNFDNKKNSSKYRVDKQQSNYGVIPELFLSKMLF
jgi:hypothetical protein